MCCRARKKGDDDEKAAWLRLVDGKRLEVALFDMVARPGSAGAAARWVFLSIDDDTTAIARSLLAWMEISPQPITELIPRLAQVPAEQFADWLEDVSTSTLEGERHAQISPRHTRSASEPR